MSSIRHEIRNGFAAITGMMAMVGGSATIITGTLFALNANIGGLGGMLVGTTVVTGVGLVGVIALCFEKYLRYVGEQKRPISEENTISDLKERVTQHDPKPGSSGNKFAKIISDLQL